MTVSPAPTPDLDDAALLGRYVQTGDREALGHLFARHMDAAYRLARRYADRAADAEDAVQAAFLRVLRRAADYRGGSSVKAYILGAVVSECRHRVREESRRVVREASAARPEQALSPIDAHDAEVRQSVLTAVNRLPEHYRLPLWLHYYEGLSSGDVAATLNLSDNTVRRQLARGVDRLRTTLGPAGRAMSVAALVHDGLIYILSQGGTLEVFEAKTGKVVYAQKLDMYPYVGYTEALGCVASPTLAGKYLYVFDNSGTCVVFEPGRQFKQAARNVLEHRAQVNAWNENQEQVWSTRVFAGRQMYLRGPEYLYCMGAKE